MDDAELEAEKKENQRGVEIKSLAKKIAEAHKQIDNAYEEKLRRIEAEKKLLPDEKAEESLRSRIVRLKERLSQLKSMISDARRQGKDPFIADLMLKNVNAKIKMAEATREERDFGEVERIIINSEAELKEALAEDQVDVKKEITTRLRQTIARESGKVAEE
jgi:hypothetical protein